MATPKKQTTDIPSVPQTTPMFQEDTDQDGHLTKHLTRTWIIFFERLAKKVKETVNQGAAGPFHRTLLLKDLTIGNDIADIVDVCDAAGTGLIITGALRKPIIKDLIVRASLDGATIFTFTFPKDTPVRKELTSTTFANDPQDFPLRALFTWDVVDSDGSKDANGVASVSVYWQ